MYLHPFIETIFSDLLQLIKKYYILLDYINALSLFALFSIKKNKIKNPFFNHFQQENKLNKKRE